MKVSVAIPAYNSSKTIAATLNSVLIQTLPPYEIIVLDDGSTDNTASILNSYGKRIKIFQQENQGVACARNALSSYASGDIIAFLDHDDIWHPSYLETQQGVFHKYPKAVAYFSGHVNFLGYDNFQWDNIPYDKRLDVEVINPLRFFKLYNESTGLFASMSYCCVQKRALAAMGDKPFCVSGVDDSYFCNVLALLGPVVYNPIPLVAYRMTMESQSVNKLRDFGLWLEVFKLLEDRFREQKDKKMRRTFLLAYASRRRQYAKRLMGAGNVSGARKQLWHSLGKVGASISMAKSLALLMSTCLPSKLQPKWPKSTREVQ